MVSTRAMARQGPVPSDDKENEDVPNLRKKPVRRATAKQAKPAPTKQTTAEKPKQLPLSPKKITQVSRTTKKTETTTNTSKQLNHESVKASTARVAARAGTRTLAVGNSRSRHAGPNIEMAEGVPRHDSVKETKEKNNRGAIQDAKPKRAPPPAKVSKAGPKPSNPQEQRSTRSRSVMRSPAPAASPQKDNDDLTDDVQDESDDELCGPKTPMRRQTATNSVPASRTEAEAEVHESPAPTPRPYQTPARQPIRSYHVAPQTQKVPTKPPADVSPQRPMTLSRGSNVAYVFRPLPKARTPPPAGRDRGIYQWPKTPVEEAEDPMEDSGLPMRARTPENGSSRSVSRNGKNNDRTPLARQRLVQLFSAETDDSASDDDDEDEDEDESKAGDCGHDADASYAPELRSPSTVAEDSNHDLLESVAPAEDAEPSILSIEDDSELSVEESEYRSELIDSSPAQSTPTLKDPFSFHSADTSPVAVPGRRISTYSSADESELGDESEIGTFIDEPRTPHAEPYHDSPEGIPFKTPRMRAALADLERRDSLNQLGESETIANQANELTMCIDPSLLGCQTAELEMHRRDDTADQMTARDKEESEVVEKLEKNARANNASGSPVKSRAKKDETVRLSMFLNTDELLEDESEATGLDSDATVIMNEVAPEQRSESQAPSTVQEQASHDLFHSEHQPTATEHPHYAQSTFAFDVRRKSMPVMDPQTPRSNNARPRTAETAIKPGVSANMTDSWTERQTAHQQLLEQRHRRRSTLGLIQLATPQQVETNTPRTSTGPSGSIRAQRSTPALRKSILDISVLKATPTAAAAADAATATPNPRPRAYTPTCSFAKPKQLSPTKPQHRSPVKTPAKSSAQTPGAYAFTPHPSAPLRSVLALVEIFTLDGSDASQSFVASLRRLGARTTKTWSDRVTHVVFKDGSPATLQKIRLSNKQHADQAPGIFCVNSRWVTDCDSMGRRMDEQAEEYAVDVSDVPRGGHRRRKSMEPAALRNVDGNVVSLSSVSSKAASHGRSSMARASILSSAWGDSPIKGRLEDLDSSLESEQKSPRVDEVEDFGSMETPEQRQTSSELALIQKTMPVNKVRRFNLKGLKSPERRRLTTWEIQE